MLQQVLPQQHLVAHLAEEEDLVVVLEAGHPAAHVEVNGGEVLLGGDDRVVGNALAKTGRDHLGDDAHPVAVVLLRVGQLQQVEGRLPGVVVVEDEGPEGVVVLQVEEGRRLVVQLLRLLLALPSIIIIGAAVALALAAALL